MIYEDSEYLLLSGLQHFAFCRRQWALIHIEQQWAENYRTVDGSLMHKHAHDIGKTESRGDIKIARGIYVSSPTLGISGQCDVLEFHRSPDGISIFGWEGTWQPFPIEYKRGKPKESDFDELQLCAQAMCLEEMLCCSIPCGALFYGETHRRSSVEFTEELRGRVRSLLAEMHELYRRGYTPIVKHSKFCNACSLNELCLPKMAKSRSAKEYLRNCLEDDI